MARVGHVHENNAFPVMQRPSDLLDAPEIFQPWSLLERIVRTSRRFARSCLRSNAMNRSLRVLLALALALSVAAGRAQHLPPPVDLPIRNIPQETDVWCWAAVAQQIVMATRGASNTPPQCALVAIANDAPAGACCSGYNPACVRTGSIAQIRSLIARFGGRPSVCAAPTDPMTLYRTLAAGYAVIIPLSAMNLFLNQGN
jgi:hypothetical protein